MGHRVKRHDRCMRCVPGYLGSGGDVSLPGFNQCSVYYIPTQMSFPPSCYPYAK